ncbi:MAG: CHAT domain-containing protein [Symploca sp. SIO1A3]|nr:CHAT domain-containing protein [Symploca sp. SIO1A3]
MLPLRRRWHRFLICFLASLVSCLVFFPWLTPTTAAQFPQSSVPLKVAQQSDQQLVEQGIENYQRGNLAEAIANWEEALTQITVAEDRATVHNNLAIAYRETGKLSPAIKHWQQAIELYRSQVEEEQELVIAELLLNQAQAYSDLGQHNRAIKLLQPTAELELLQQEQLTKAAVKGALGNAYRALGDYEQALAAHQESLDIARELNNSSYISMALNDLGNTYVSRANRYQEQANSALLEGEIREYNRLTAALQQDRAEARELLQQSVEAARDVAPKEELRALMNLNRLLNKTQAQPTTILNNWQRVNQLLPSIPDSREKAYALIQLAQNTPSQQSFQILEQALAISKKLGDARAESFVLGTLGKLHQARNEYAQGMEWTREAQFKAQQINAPDSLYRWQWQAGQILKATGNSSKAIAAYQQAIATLQTIRGDIVNASKDLQFDFRDQVEPVYRELMTLLLESPTKVVSSSQAKEVVDTLELLKLAELQNFFGDECVEVAVSQGGAEQGLRETNTVVIYSVVLDNFTEMILRSPDGSMSSYRVPISKQELEQEVTELRSLLERRQTYEYLPKTEEVYDLLIRPLEAKLAASKPSTVVFINDGVLRKIPMAALYDGEQFLIEKYALATTPGLKLTSRQGLDQQNLSTLSLGLTVARPPFAPLSNVEAEVTAVKDILGGNQLVDEAFTLANFQSQLQQQNYPIVHIATHGKFGADRQTTFLVGYDQKISIEVLDNLLRSRHGGQPVELLTLSACQTAAGDDRSALGLAGVAVRAGVGSALATLWYINDESTVPLIEEFYQQLSQPNITKAEALRKAQLRMIADQEFDYNHPAVWSPFILIGNWL